MTEQEQPIRPVDLARKVIADFPGASKAEHGRQLDRLINEESDARWLVDWRTEKLHAALGAFVAQVKAGDERDRAPKVTYHGRAMRMTPTISSGGRLSLWLEISPREWIAAVQREQNVAIGRVASNQKRLPIVEKLLGDEELLELPTMAAVIAALNLDPDDIVLDEEAS